MPLLTSQEIADITSSIHGIVGDSSIGTTIKYRLAGVSREYFFDPSSQEIGSTGFAYLESSVSAFKSSYNLDEIEASGGLVEFGDLKFIIMTSKVTGVLSTTDTIYESGTSKQSGTTYQVVGVERDPLAICYFLQCRAVG